MKVMTENRVEPKLRFRDFEREWIKSTLGNELDYTKGFAFKSNDYTDKGVRIVRVSDLLSSSIKTNNEKVFISKDDESKYLKYKIQKGNIIITTVGSHPDLIESAVGRGIYILHNDEGLLNQNMLKLENNNTVNNKFIHSIINSPRYIHYIKSIKRGNANQANITVKELLQYKISLPSISEQQKIASFLSAVDEKLQQLTKKKELLEEYKKGVMQHIFSGELRFKDDKGNNYPDWEEKKLGEVVSERNIKAPKSNSYPLMSFVAYKGVRPKGKRYNREFLVNDENNKKYKKTEYGDFIYSSNNLETGSIGLNRYGAASISPVYSIFKIGELCNYQFISSYLLRKIFINKMIGFRQGVVYGQWKIHESNFLKIKDKFPSLEEQNKIADFLSALDSKIELVRTQIENTKAFKKGLLQQMFV